MKPETFKPEHFIWQYDSGIATIQLDRPERKNPLTFDSYAELRDTFRDLVYQKDVKAVIFAPNGGNFSSGGDVHEIIGPLVNMDMSELLDFTRMTGDLIKAIRACPQPVIAAVDGISVGAGAIIPMASDLRIGTPESKTAFFVACKLSSATCKRCASTRSLPGFSLSKLTTKKIQELRSSSPNCSYRISPTRNLNSLDSASGMRLKAALCT